MSLDRLEGVGQSRVLKKKAAITNEDRIRTLLKVRQDPVWSTWADQSSSCIASLDSLNLHGVLSNEQEQSNACWCHESDALTSHTHPNRVGPVLEQLRGIEGHTAHPTAPTHACTAEVPTNPQATLEPSTPDPACAITQHTPQIVTLDLIPTTSGIVLKSLTETFVTSEATNGSQITSYIAARCQVFATRV